MDRRLLIASALVAAFALNAPAAADHPAGVHVSSDRSTARERVRERFADESACRDDGRHHRGGDGRLGCAAGFDGWAYADGQWALYNNRSWEPDSYNDWWNDRPDRAFPRWVQEQRAHGTCDPDRMWWSGSGWHC